MVTQTQIMQHHICFQQSKTKNGGQTTCDKTCTVKLKVWTQLKTEKA